MHPAIIACLVLATLALVLTCVWFLAIKPFLTPSVKDKVMHSMPDESDEGLFSRVTNWIGCGLYAEDNGAAALVLQSLDERKQYTDEGTDLCKTLLATSCHEMRKGALKTRRKVVAKRTMGNHLWVKPLLNLSNRGLPNKTGRPFKEVQKAVLKYAMFNAEHESGAQEFWDKFFPGCKQVLGLHWRGTDTSNRWPHVSHDAEYFIQTAVNELTKGGYDGVFVASDEQGFVDECWARLNSDSKCESTYRRESGRESGRECMRVVVQDCPRSSNGVALHLSESRSPSLNAKAVILDALILSRCYHIIKGRSCVSDYAILRNPEISCDLLLTTTKKYRKERGADSEFTLCSVQK